MIAAGRRSEEEGSVVAAVAVVVAAAAVEADYSLEEYSSQSGYSHTERMAEEAGGRMGHSTEYRWGRQISRQNSPVSSSCLHGYCL